MENAAMPSPRVHHPVGIPVGPFQMEQAYVEQLGRVAFLDEIPMGLCPFQIRHDLRHAWIKGWRSEKRDISVLQKNYVEEVETELKKLVAKKAVRFGYCRAETGVGRKCNRGGRYGGYCHQHRHLSVSP
jgi:hypothetical protein